MPNKLIIEYRDLKALLDSGDLRSVLSKTDLKALAALDPTSLNRYFTSGQEITFADLAALGFGKSPSDGLSLSDANTAEFGKGASDSISVSESLSIVVTILRSFTDSVSFVDLPAPNVQKQLGDQYQLDDAPSVGTSLFKSDSFSFGDIDSFDFAKGVTDQITVGESLSFTVGSNRTFSDAFALDDAATVDALIKESASTKTNVFGFSDDQAFGFDKSASDSFSLSESIDSFVFGKGVTDAVSVTENLSVVIFSNAAMNAATLNSSPFNQ